ncbi:MAG TPA: pitrilysin family protein [Bryobacteraceae bacterium]|jgi:zinc protease|nr:pitrilysin family protein [Bryobacteraceae bacterium]
MRLRNVGIVAAGLLSASLLFAAGKIFPYQYVQEDLPNGLRLITIPTDYPNIVSLFIVVGAGSRNEVEPGKSGFAHLFEHLMFRGTPEFSPERYEAEIQNAGAASNAFTSDDLTAFHTTFSKEDLARILSMEADRFAHLSFSQDAFKTETRAVLGEYNKNSANPNQKLFETLRATAFKVHTYQHSTMGFLKDIEAMPDEYDYSKQFFDRYYRPEYTTIIVAGDVDPKRVRSLIDERWGTWKRGTFKVSVPAEPPQNGPRTAHVDWPAETLPWLAVAYRGPAYSDTSEETAALDAISRLGFNQTSPLYQKLVIDEQKVDAMFAGPPNNLDPELFSVMARIKKAADLPAVEQQVIETVEGFAAKPVDGKKLDALKEHLRYEFALQLDNSEAIASTVAQYVALRRTPETINRYYDAYARLTPADIQKAAQKYLMPNNRTVVTLTSSVAEKKADPK